MNTIFTVRFNKDLKSIPKSVRKRIQSVIEEVEKVSDLWSISNIKPLKGETGAYHRIRVGDYRIGIRMQGQTVKFSRCLHRQSMYKTFP